MKIELTDTIEIEDGSVRRTGDGYLVANARVARTGVQTYSARELGLKDRDPSSAVRVYRPPAEVFAADAMNSIAWRPMTNDHPRGRVTADNWKALSVGNAGGEVIRDGHFVRVPLTLMDSAAIRAYDAGKKELSVGYSCEVEMQDGVVPDGEPDAGQTYDAVQHNIRANHIALCDKARGGDKLRIGDHEPQPENKPVKTILVDGIPVSDVSDAAEAVITKLQKDLADARKASGEQATQIATLTADCGTKDGEIAALTAKLKDAEVTPERLSQMAADRAALEDVAKPLLGDAFDFKAKTDGDIRRAVVAKTLGDAAATMDDNAILGAFSVLAKDAGKKAQPGGDLRRALADSPQGTEDPRAARDAARRKWVADTQGAYRENAGADA